MGGGGSHLHQENKDPCCHPTWLLQHTVSVSLNAIRNHQLTKWGIFGATWFNNRYLVVNAFSFRLEIEYNVMKVSSINVQFVDRNYQHSVILINIFSLNIKEKNISVNLVIRSIQMQQVSDIIVKVYMKVWHTIVIFVCIKLHRKQVCHHTLSQFISKKDTNVKFAIIKQHRRAIYPYI